MSSLVKDRAEKIAERIREHCPSAQVVVREGRAVIEIDSEEAFEAEYRKSMLITRSIMEAGGVPR